MRTTPRLRAIALSLTLVAGAAACGDDDDAASTTTTADEPTTVEVTAVDYGFEGLPDEISAGTRLTLVNDSDVELHELVAVRIPDDEQRSVDELLALPEEESSALLGSGPPATVLLAAPGSDEQIEAVGDGTIGAPGRYLVMCAIPQGADPDAYLNAPPSDGPPDVEGGPPHFTLGMAAELLVS